MKGYCLISSILLLCVLTHLSSGIDRNPVVALSLQKGDHLKYEINIKRSKTISDFGRDPQFQKVDEKTKFSLTVKDIPEPGIYLFTYQKLFTKITSTSEENIIRSDSRFPEYGNHLRAVISCYLNSAEYSVLLNSKAGSLTLANLNLIKTGLTEYIKSRGIEFDEHARLECDYFTREEIILQDLGVLNFYPGELDIAQWHNMQPDSTKEQFCVFGESDTSILIRSEVPEFRTLPDYHGIRQKGIRLPRLLTVDAGTGILLKATSIQDGSSNIKSPNYQYNLELFSYSKWDKPTIVCGQIQGFKSERLCLRYQSSIVGSDVDYIYVDAETDGSFSISLDIMDPVKYSLFLLESFAVSSNEHVQLYVEPGDSIHVFVDKDNNFQTQFSGKGYRNSEFLNRGSLDSRVSFLIRTVDLRYYLPKSYYESIDRTRKSIVESERLLEAEKAGLTLGFYAYMSSEIQSLKEMIKVAEATKSLTQKADSADPSSKSFSALPLPQVPAYDNLSNLELFPFRVSQYANFRFRELQQLHKNRYGYNTRTEQMVFSRIILEGYPLYADLVIQLEALAKRTDIVWLNYKNLFGEFLESCNNREIYDYVRHLYDRLESLQPGSEMPRMDLIDLGGSKWNWEKTNGKIVVLALSGDYNGAHYLCEDLYKLYGYNKKDVIILRISPGISFQQWRNFHTRYSSEMHQMYFPDGVDVFNERFTFSFHNRIGFLVIDRNGKIFRNASVTDIKTAIKAALAQPLPLRKPFIETTFARILFGALLGMLITFVLYRIIIHRKLKRRALANRMSELEQKAMKAQLNPHFLFNSLNSIQHLIRSNQLQSAESYLSKFAALVRKILDHSEKESVSISKEMESIRVYLELEQMRFGFQYDLKVSPDIDIHNTMIPTMMLQPVVENAILHGLLPKKGDKELIIAANIQDDSIVFEVKDNGIGRATSSKSLQKHNSKGLSIIQSRIDIMNRNEPSKYRLEIIDLEDEEQKSIGTLVQLSFPDEI